MKKIVFIGAQNQPRMIKRILSFYEKSYKMEVYGFDRDRFHGENKLPSDITIHRFEKTEDGGKYIRKLFLYVKQVYNVYKKHKKENVVFYSFSILPSFFLYLFGCHNYIYEISDIIYANFKNPFIRSIIRKIDQKLIKRSAATVMTSEGFISYLFKDNEPDNIIVLPNKVSSFFSGIAREMVPISGTVRFAFIGWLRYPNTIFRFAEIIGKHYPNYSFKFFGDSNYRDQAAELANKYGNITFSGSFRNPEDLKNIYEQVDVVISCYDTSTINERIAEPNKLYEAMFFCKPIVVSPGTFLANQVARYKCGYTLDASCDSNIYSFLDSVNIEELNNIGSMLYRMKKEQLIDNPSPLLDFVGSM